MTRRPAVNLGQNPYYNYYEDQRPFMRELELDRKDNERAKKYCIIHSILLVYDKKSEHFICPECGWFEGANDIQVISEVSALETSTHLRTQPGGKNDRAIKSITESQAALLSVDAVPNQASRIRGRKVTEDPDTKSLKDRGYTIMSEEEWSADIGTMSSADSAKQKARV